MNTNKTFFSSDHHFYHNNVIKYSQRPYADVEEMNQALIDNINAVVGEHDTFYMVGDIAFAKTVGQLIAIMKRINCRNIHWIIGNHDKFFQHPELVHYFKSIRDYKEIEVQGQRIVLFHFPILEWNRCARGAWMLHGHTHGHLKSPDQLKNKRITDVGVDCWNYSPVSFEQLADKFKNCEDLAHH